MEPIDTELLKRVGVSGGYMEVLLTRLPAMDVGQARAVIEPINSRRVRDTMDNTPSEVLGRTADAHIAYVGRDRRLYVESAGNVEAMVREELAGIEQSRAFFDQHRFTDHPLPGHLDWDGAHQSDMAVRRGLHGVSTHYQGLLAKVTGAERTA